MFVYLSSGEFLHETQYLLCYIVKNLSVYGNKKGGYTPPEKFAKSSKVELSGIKSPYVTQ